MTTTDFCLANDISKGSYGINKVRQTFAGAYGIMQAASFMRAGILSSRRDGVSYRLRLVTNPEDMSILSSILGVTQEVGSVSVHDIELTELQMINNRRLLQEVYDKRLLHNLLHVHPQAPVVIAEVPNEDAKGIEWDDDSDGVHEVVEHGESDESGRYDIQGSRPKNGTDALTTYTTDEELSEGLEDDVRKRRYWLSKGENGVVV